MSVPRETSLPDALGKRTVRKLSLPAEMFAALDTGQKRTHRFVVDAHNSHVRPGSFAGLDLESGRRRITDGNDGQPMYELRARCRFESGDVRAVSVRPQFQPRDLFWVKPGRGRVIESRHTLEVVRVDVARLQDIGEAESLAEGIDVSDIEPPPVFFGVARERFEQLWDRTRRGSNYWRLNPWVWVVHFDIHAGNVRDLFGGEV